MGQTFRGWMMVCVAVLAIALAFRHLPTKHAATLLRDAICISVDTSADRRRDTAKEFTNGGFPTPVFSTAPRDAEDPRRGCYDAHVRCMRRAVARRQKYAVVFEDDVGMVREAPRGAWAEVVRFVNDPAMSFDVLLMGWCPGTHRKEVCRSSTQQAIGGYKHLVRGKCFCLHAVVYSKKFMTRFLKEYPRFDADKEQPEIDDVIVDMPGVDIVLVKPPLFRQRDVASVIDPTCGAYRHDC